jgi:hypothetical protein
LVVHCLLDLRPSVLVRVLASLVNLPTSSNDHSTQSVDLRRL